VGRHGAWAGSGGGGGGCSAAQSACSPGRHAVLGRVITAPSAKLSPCSRRAWRRPAPTSPPFPPAPPPPPPPPRHIHQQGPSAHRPARRPRPSFRPSPFGGPPALCRRAPHPPGSASPPALSSPPACTAVRRRQPLQWPAGRRPGRAASTLGRRGQVPWGRGARCAGMGLLLAASAPLAPHLHVGYLGDGEHPADEHPGQHVVAVQGLAQPHLDLRCGVAGRWWWVGGWGAG
jgi:hypothetical protein